MADFQVSFVSSPGYFALDICQFVNNTLEVPKAETETSGLILSVTEFTRILTPWVVITDPLLKKLKITFTVVFLSQRHTNIHMDFTVS